MKVCVGCGLFLTILLRHMKRQFFVFLSILAATAAMAHRQTTLSDATDASAECEMIIQSRLNILDKVKYEIELLPALPEKWKDGSVEGICARGGFEVSMTWKDGRVSEARIHSKKGGKVRVIYNGTEKVLQINKGKTKIL